MNTQSIHVEMCAWVTQVQAHTHTYTHTHTLGTHNSSLPTWLFQRQRREWHGGCYYSSAVINIRCTFSAMQRCWWGLVIDGGGHYISLALVYLSLPPLDTNKPHCLQWTSQHRSTRIEHRCCVSHLCYWHSWVSEGQNKQPPHHCNIWIMVIGPATSMGLKLLWSLLLTMMTINKVTWLIMANQF